MTRRRIAVGAMVAGLIGVGAWQAVAASTGGPPPDPPGVQQDGSIDVSEVPACVPVADNNGNVVGCVARNQLFASPAAPFAQPSALRVINGKGKPVGWFVPGKGFVKSAG